MSNVVPGSASTSQYDNGTKFRQLVNDYLADSPKLAREYLELQGIRPSREEIIETAKTLLPQYIEYLVRFQNSAHPAISQTIRDEAMIDALTRLLIDEHLELSAEIIQNDRLEVSRSVRESVRPLAEFEMTAALKSERLGGIIELGSAIDPMFFHQDLYCSTLTTAILSYLEGNRLDKLAKLIETPVQIPDSVIYKTRSEIELGILRHVEHGGNLTEPYILSEMFMLTDFFQSAPFLGAVKKNIEGCLSNRQLPEACRWAEECHEFHLIRRDLGAVANIAVKHKLAEFRYYATDERSRENSALLERLNSTIRDTVEVFRLDKTLVEELPPLAADRRVLRVGHRPCRLVHPQRRSDDD